MSGAVAASNVRGLNCPNCGGALTIRAFGQSLTVVCPQCLAVLDAKDPNLQILQKAEQRMHVPLLIPLGTRGKLRGDSYEAIGFQVRTVQPPDDEPYSWHEYLLFNPFKGFRYLTEYNGHWNDVKTVQAVPELMANGFFAKLLGRNYKHFSTETALTTYVVGEFPWRVRVGETVEVSDYVAPPRVLSAEKTESETVWSRGEYMTGAQVWEAFKLPGHAPAAEGVFENEPSPYKGNLGGMWSLCLKLLLAAFALAALLYATAPQRPVFHQAYNGAGSVVTPPFDLKGRASALQVTTRTLAGGWLYLRYALVNQTTGQAREFARDIDGTLRTDSAIIPAVAPGRYYLRIEPEIVPGAMNPQYDVLVRQGVVATGWFWLAALLLLAPPAVMTWRTIRYEGARWSNSLR